MENTQNMDEKEKKKLYMREYRKKNAEKTKAYQKEYYKKYRSDENRPKYLANKKKAYQKNKTKINEDNQKRYAANKEKYAKSKKEYYEKNKTKLREANERWKAENKERNKELKKIWYEKNKHKRSTEAKIRKSTDPLFKLKTAISSRIRAGIKSRGFLKNFKTKEILGCTYEEFKQYLETKFEPWMNWNNYGKYNSELNFGWDLDHIVPLVTATTEEDVIKLNHHTNFQPLCSRVNRDIKWSK